MRPTVAFVGANVPEGEPIYVEAEPVLYFLSGRPPAARWHEARPGLTDREEVRAEILGSLDGRGVRCIVQRRPAGATPRPDFLDDWIAAEFATIASYGEWRVLVRDR